MRESLRAKHLIGDYYVEYMKDSGKKESNKQPTIFFKQASDLNKEFSNEEIIVQEWEENSQEPEQQELCCGISSPRNVREQTLSST